MSISKDFSNTLWYEKVTGAGSTATDDSGLSLIAKAAAGDLGYKRYYINAMPGEKLEFRVNARNLSADGFADFAGIWIDSPIDSILNVEKVNSDEMKPYIVSCVIPHTNDKPVRVAFGLGSFSSLDGSAEYINPVITRSGGGLVMQCMLDFPDTGGLPVVRFDALNSGVGTIEWRGGNSTVRIKPAFTFSFDESGAVNQYDPLLQVTGGYEGNATEVYHYYGQTIGNNGWIEIQICNAAGPINTLTSTNQDRVLTFSLRMMETG